MAHAMPPRGPFIPLVVFLLTLGCGSRAAPPPADVGSIAAPADAVTAPMPAAGRPSTPATKPPEVRKAVAPDEFAAEPPTKDSAAETPPARDLLPNRETPIDDARIAAAGIRKLTGRHLTLYTDLSAGAAIDELVDVFDQAYPLWCDYFAAPQLRNQSWHLIACVIGDKRSFAAVGLLPANLPPFLHAYFRGDRLWVYDQPNDYYRRHLLLHEGTHAFMYGLFGANGPPWYSEGMAELLATHTWKDGRLTLDYFPATADDVPGWGRVRLVHDAIKAGRRLKMGDVLEYDGRAHVEVEPYGWCWAAAAFLDGHPRYRERFRKLPPHIAAKDFNRVVRETYADDWAQLAEEWQLFATNLDYGFDFAREVIDFRPGKPLATAGTTVTVAADRGWQSSGIELEAGKSYRLTATGRYQVARAPRPWWCEPAGVTIRYWHGHPLGVLLAAVHPEGVDPRADSPLLSPLVIGPQAVIRPIESGTLYLRINDSAAELSDNSGKLDVQVLPE